jgi:hypothetical protein
MAGREIDYYRRRAIQEQVAAQNAKCPTAQMIHDELAAAYRFRVSMLNDVCAEAGVAIALRQPPQLPNSGKGSMTAVSSWHAARRHPGAACLEG